MNKFVLIVLFFVSISSSAQFTADPLYKNEQQIKWVNDVYNSMSLDDKIGQLFMVAAYSNKGAAHEAEIRKLIENERIGGLIFMQDDAIRQIELVNEYQKLAKVPLLMGMDAEWDVSMRLKNSNRFPWAMTTAALTENPLLTQMGERVSAHLKRTGIHFNFAPVADVNVNPQNPIIGNRAYGSDAENIAGKAWAYAEGMQRNGILTSAKHFPGHGDTDQDSHKTLPSIPHDRARLDSVELKPFRDLIAKGITGIMVAHLAVPALEPDAKIPASLSHNIITRLLKEEMGFKGLIVTDALNMDGVTKNFPNGMTDYMAFEAGNDILLFSQAVATGKAKIKEGLESGKILESRLEESVKKILMAKYFAGLNRLPKLAVDGVHKELNDAQSLAVTARIFEEATTLLKNENHILPIIDVHKSRFGWMGLEEGEKEEFFTYLNKYTQVDRIDLSKSFTIDDLERYDYVFISIHKDNSTPYKSYKISQKSQDLIRQFSQKTKVILTIFGSPYALLNFDDQLVKATIVAYQNHTDAMRSVPQLIFGAIPFKGKLPVTLNENYTYGTCLETVITHRLGYTLPENAGMKSEKLNRIDELAEWAMEIKATPGMQILVARNGKVVYDKSFGYFTYDKKDKVAWNHLYDVASVTKIVSTMPLLMSRIEKNYFSLDEPLRHFIPRAIFSDKNQVSLREILAHQAGFYPWIPFYKETIDSVTMNYKPGYYSTEKKMGFETEVAKNLFIRNAYRDSMMNKIFLKESVARRYRYSDLGYYLFQDYLERNTYQSLDYQLDKSFFEPLGMNYTTYNPLKKFELEQIVPTENDLVFRKQQIQGYVHDQGAAMLGGVAGHAGIFSNSNDLAKMMQMFLNNGVYGGRKYLTESVIKEFTSYQYRNQGNRRGLGFDKQLGTNGPAYSGVSSSSYGHSGFTGTLVWADPEYNLVYVFLSNRVYPTSDNRKLIQNEIREKIHQRIYEAL
ncbi:MAG: glycoside hydrolase family 3 N-terminal domain-containing protein [Flavobacteriaceae bacterium]|nr:glycoside hydrolase family 3 N-terminal domain-containing protein [Flavobacteriaceae bacterium]